LKYEIERTKLYFHRPWELYEQNSSSNPGSSTKVNSSPIPYSSSSSSSIPSPNPYQSALSNSLYSERERERERKGDSNYKPDSAYHQRAGNPDPHYNLNPNSAPNSNFNRNFLGNTIETNTNPYPDNTNESDVACASSLMDFTMKMTERVREAKRVLDLTGDAVGMFDLSLSLGVRVIVGLVLGLGLLLG
jgi:hypothetical protein